MLRPGGINKKKNKNLVEESVSIVVTEHKRVCSLSFQVLQMKMDN